jgi:hypothetical protein
MNRLSLAFDDPHRAPTNHMREPAELQRLFHRLNNQLGIVLAHAELLEANAGDDTSRARAAQVVGTTLEAMGTAKEIRLQIETPK